MKRFNLESATQEQIETHCDCFQTKHELWDMIHTFYEKTREEKSFEENMIILRALKLVSDMDIDEVIASAYNQILEDEGDLTNEEEN